MNVGNQVAGMQAGRTPSPRDILLSPNWKHTISGVMDSGATDPTNDYSYIIRGCRLLARHTTTKRWWPLKRTTALAFASSGASSTTPTDYTDVPVADATPFAVGDVVTIGGDTGLTILAVDTTGGNQTIRVDSGTFAFAADEQVFEQTNGLGICRGILLDDEVILRDVQNLAAAHKEIKQILVAGMVDSSLVRGDVSALRASMMGTSPIWHPIQGSILFDEDFGFGA